MADRIGGWNITANGNNAIAVASKAAATNRQHVLNGIDVSFSATPSAPVHLRILASATSPGTMIWEGYVSGAYVKNFPDGLCVSPGSGVEVILSAAGNGVIGVVNLQGITL